MLNISFLSNRKLASFQKIKEWKQERKKKIENRKISRGCYYIYKDPRIRTLTLMNLNNFSPGLEQE